MLFNIFTELQLDAQSRMCWIHDQNVQTASVMELLSLSSPLVVAKEEHKLGFSLFNGIF